MLVSIGNLQIFIKCNFGMDETSKTLFVQSRLRKIEGTKTSVMCQKCQTIRDGIITSSYLSPSTTYDEYKEKKYFYPDIRVVSLLHM